MRAKRFISIIAGVLALVVFGAALCACGEKPSIVKTEEGKKLTAKKWQTNYFGHSEVKFSEDGSVVITIENVGDPVDVDGKWSIDGKTLTVETYKNYDDNGDLKDITKKNSYEYADYMSDDIINGGDQKIEEIREKYEKDGEKCWFVSDEYLYFTGSVWYPKE